MFSSKNCSTLKGCVNLHLLMILHKQICEQCFWLQQLLQVHSLNDLQHSVIIIYDASLHHDSGYNNIWNTSKWCGIFYLISTQSDQRSRALNCQPFLQLSLFIFMYKSHIWPWNFGVKYELTLTSWFRPVLGQCQQQWWQTGGFQPEVSSCFSGGTGRGGEYTVLVTMELMQEYFLILSWVS